MAALIKQNDLEALKVISWSEIISYSDSTKGTSALHYAVWLERKEIVEYLLTSGFDVNRRDAGGGTALFEAVSTGNIEIVKMLVEKGIDINAKTTDGAHTALYPISGIHSEIAVYEYLLSKGADANAYTKMGITLLQEAEDNDREDIKVLLLKYGADPNFKPGIDWDKILSEDQSPEAARKRMEDF